MSRKDTAQVPLHRAAVKPNLNFGATRSIRVREQAGGVKVVVCIFCISAYRVYTIRYNEEFYKKLINWKISLETLQNSLNFSSLPIKYLPIKLE